MTNFEKFATGVMLAGLAVTAAKDLLARARRKSTPQSAEPPKRPS